MPGQINVRLEDDALAGLDALAEEQGLTRTELVRRLVLERLRAESERRIRQVYEDAYSSHPETDEELDRAEGAARRLTSAEPWDPWW